MTSPTTDRRQGLIGNTPIKAPVDCATTGNITLSGEQIIDGFLTSQSRVLVWQQTDATKNGIYDSSSAAWTRSADADGNYDLTTGTVVNIVGGSSLGGSFFQVTTAKPITIGSSLLIWIKALFSSSSILSFIASGIGAVVRSVQDELRDTVKPEQFGAIGDGVTNDAAAFITALSKNKTVHCVSGKTYKINAPLTIDLMKQSLNGNGAILDFSALTGTQQALIMTNSGGTPSDIVPGAAYNAIRGFKILGPGIGTTVTGVYQAAPHTVIEHCLFYQFGIGIDIFSQGYNLKYYSVNVGQCGIAIRGLAGGTNYGEQITFFGCTIYDNNLGISNNMANGTMAFMGGHFDYNIKTFECTNSSTTELHSVWCEQNDAGAGNAHATLFGASNFLMFGGRITMNGTLGALTQVGYFTTGATSYVSLRNVFLFNLQNTAGCLDSGSGVVDVDGTISYSSPFLPTKLSATLSASSRLADGGFEGATVQDYWSITADTGAITNRLTGTNVVLSQDAVAPHSGTKSLKCVKGGGGAGDFDIIVPVRPGCRAAFECWVKTAGAGAGFFISNVAYRIEGTASNGVPNIVNALAFDVVQTATTQGWTKYQSSRIQVPSWATHYGIKFGGNPFTGTLNVDDVYISTM